MGTLFIWFLTPAPDQFRECFLDFSTMRVSSFAFVDVCLCLPKAILNAEKYCGLCFVFNLAVSATLLFPKWPFLSNTDVDR